MAAALCKPFYAAAAAAANTHVYAAGKSWKCISCISWKILVKNECSWKILEEIS